MNQCVPELLSVCAVKPLCAVAVTEMSKTKNRTKAGRQVGRTGATRYYKSLDFAFIPRAVDR